MHFESNLNRGVDFLLKLIRLRIVKSCSILESGCEWIKKCIED